MSRREYACIRISEEMLAEARRLEEVVRVDRTRASEVDSLAGILGEFAFAAVLYGDWRRHRVEENRGQVDFGDIEVKTSAFPFHESLNLLVREDYALRRTPAFYVQVVLDVESSKAASIPAGTEAVIAGWERGHIVHQAPLRDFGSKRGGSAGYRCHYVAISDLQPIATLREALPAFGRKGVQ